MLLGKLLFFVSAASAAFYYNKANVRNALDFGERKRAIKGMSRTKRGSLVSSMLAKEHDRHALRKV